MKILYVCTHNRCRSILSEGLTNAQGDGLLKAKSAGSQPVGEVHPLSIKFLAERGVETTNLKSKSWNDLDDFAPDVVITVCDSAAGEACPLWMTGTLTIHWTLEDPSKLEGTPEEVNQAFEKTMNVIEKRIAKLKALVGTHPPPQQSELKKALLLLSHE